ncbi:hypothetical protein Rs2_30893 [Raphanus sativus]|uniref:Pentatricopeptide repeat-containing protein At2g27800, mitochondrial-like n=1 Tax=Raphanus sativus TaxID=3726 RepID=A0A6J0JUA3_RAPSA|nr:pentatricopeptide repeat-containing protein At2g27800, mitochondrial-like [Raphanus sativus]KAJ4891145.1 hypothetical protein Rs2_30893 [Raphanus sativus]
MAATSIASRSSLGSILRTATRRRSLISPRPRISSVPNPNPNSSSPSPPLRQTRIEASSLPRFVRREVSTHQPFHSVVAAACLVSKLPSDLTSYQGRFANYVSPI